MESEENLNELFKILREKKVTTNISDVNTWISANNTTVNLKLAGKTAIIKKAIIICSIITSTLVGSVFLFTGKQKTIPNKINSTVLEQTKDILPVDSSIRIKIESIQVRPKKTIDIATTIIPIPNLLKDSIQIEEVKNPFETQKLNLGHFPETNKQDKKEEFSGFWNCSNDTLNIDTLFNSVKVLVFEGDNKCEIMVRGSQRSSISMKYNYELKAKGFFFRKNEGNCTMSYQLKDSVLAIHLERKDQKFNGISALSERSVLEFNVPENLDVILVTGMGDISAENISGIIDLNTSLGDISMKNLKGKINVNSSNGDILGKNILISDDSKYFTSLGGIDIQIRNPLSECKISLSTSLGNINVDRYDLKTKSKNQMTVGNGKLGVIMHTSLGKIIVR